MARDVEVTLMRRLWKNGVHQWVEVQDFDEVPEGCSVEGPYPLPGPAPKPLRLVVDGVDYGPVKVCAEVFPDGEAP